MAEPPTESSEPDEQALELILARNLISIITLAAFLSTPTGTWCSTTTPRRR